MSDTENRRRIEALERDVADMKSTILKLRGANDVLSKRILDEIKKAQRSNGL
jgi:hypothetical protein